MSYFLEMRAYSYIWRDINSLSLLIYSSSPILKWLVYVYLHPYAKIVLVYYSFALEKECLKILVWTWTFIQAEPIDIKAWLYSSSFILLIYNYWFIFHKCVCLCIICLNAP